MDEAHREANNDAYEYERAWAKREEYERAKRRRERDFTDADGENDRIPDSFWDDDDEE